jgi:hypothetical protein
MAMRSKLDRRAKFRNIHAERTARLRYPEYASRRHPCDKVFEEADRRKPKRLQEMLSPSCSLNYTRFDWIARQPRHSLSVAGTGFGVWEASSRSGF